VSEVVLLKIADNDSQRMVIRVEQAKGGKDRYVMLSPQLLRILRTHWRLARPKRWLFPGRDDERPLVPNVLHAACRLVVGLPRSPSRRSSSRATRMPEIEVSKALAGAVVDHHQDAQDPADDRENALRGVLVKASHVQPRCGPNRLGARDRHCATSRSYRSRRSIQSATRNLGSRSPARSARSARQGGRSCQRH
jgi:hypothetical protein